jgi:uncharacterized membrane protein
MSGARLWAGVLSLAGLAISIYLTVVHYAQGQVSLLCATSGPINCEQVTTSPQANVGPVPVALLGIVWFLVTLVLAIGPTWQRQFASSVGWLTLRMVWSLAGLLVVFYLIYAELFLIGAVCLWCTVVHALVIGLFLLAVNEWVETTNKAESAEVQTG